MPDPGDRKPHRLWVELHEDGTGTVRIDGAEIEVTKLTITMEASWPAAEVTLTLPRGAIHIDTPAHVTLASDYEKRG